MLHKRYKLRRSSLITSNRIVDDWHKFLGDAALTTAILDRLMHRSVLVEFSGQELSAQRSRQPPCKGESFRVTIHPFLSSPWGNLTRPQMGEFEVAIGEPYGVRTENGRRYLLFSGLGF